MRSFASAMLFFALALGAAAAQETPTPLLPPPIPANAILPRPLPSAALTAWTPADGRKTVSLAVDGATLRGYEYAASTSGAPVVLFFGANGSNLQHDDEGLRALAGRGARIVAYDYRGYGFSTGRADIRTFRRDALKLYDALAATPGNEHTAVFGYSMGTALAAYVASQRSVAGLVLVAPISQALPFFKARLSPERAKTAQTTPDADEAFDETAMVAESTAPLLLIHGDADDFVPFAEGKDVFAASASTRKNFVTLFGVNHAGAIADPATLAALSRFFSSLH